MANSDQTECLHNAQVENPTQPVNSVTSNKEILRCLAACLPWNRCVEKDMDDEISDRRAHTRLHALPTPTHCPPHPPPTHPQPLTHIHLEREDQLFNPQQPISDSGCGALPFWDSCISDCIISNDGRINLHGVS